MVLLQLWDGGDGVGELGLLLLVGWSCNICHRDRERCGWLGQRLGMMQGRRVNCLGVEVMIWVERESDLSGLP